MGDALFQSFFWFSDKNRRVICLRLLAMTHDYDFMDDSFIYAERRYFYRWLLLRIAHADIWLPLPAYFSQALHSHTSRTYTVASSIYTPLSAHHAVKYMMRIIFSLSEYSGSFTSRVFEVAILEKLRHYFLYTFEGILMDITSLDIFKTLHIHWEAELRLMRCRRH